ncbi:MAG: hypothetical protein PHW46_05470 [Candidatus Omnitrophica bacterium]|nr:hypothetical protein [Candidatus Omnitrophota bacterium]
MKLSKALYIFTLIVAVLLAGTMGVKFFTKLGKRVRPWKVTGEANIKEVTKEFMFNNPGELREWEEKNLSTNGTSYSIAKDGQSEAPGAAVEAAVTAELAQAMNVPATE